MKTRRILAVLGAALCLAAAADPADRLADPRLEARARALFRETRCLVCQGQSIDDSDADLAADLRAVVRAQVQAGAADSQVRAFLVSRYGEFVLLRPPLNPGNLALWAAPFVVLLAGGALLIARRSSPATESDLTPAEEAKIADLRTRDAP